MRRTFALYLAVAIGFAEPASAAIAASGVAAPEVFCCCREAGIEMPEGEACRMCGMEGPATAAPSLSSASCGSSGPRATPVSFSWMELAEPPGLAVPVAAPFRSSPDESGTEFARLPASPPPRNTSL